MKLPITYSFVEENGFSFHLRELARKANKKISINRIARLWWIARNSPYLAIRDKGKHVLDELKVIRRANGLTISDDTLKEDLAILKTAGILITVITDDNYLLRAEYKNRNKDVIRQLISG